MLRLAPALAIVILTGPIAFGLLATLLPALGYFPSLGGETFSLEPFYQLFDRPGLWRSVVLSFSSGIITTAISLTIVLLFVAGWSGTAIFRRLQYMVSPLLSVPHAAAAFGLAFLIAPSGWILRIMSPELTGFERPPDVLILNDPMGLSMMAGLIVKETPFLLLVILAALPQTNARHYTRIAAGLGYGRIAGFIHCVWPQTYGQIRLAVFAVIAYASSVVDVAIILGPDSPAPLSPRLLSWMNDPDLALRFEASAGAILQLGVTIAALVFWLAVEKVGALLRSSLCQSGTRFVRDWPLRAFGVGSISLSAILVFLGLAILAIWSIAGFWSFPDALPDTFSLKSWRRSWPSLGQPLWNSLLVGTIATLIAIIITLACLEQEARTGRSGGSRSLLFVYLPLIVPQTGFVFGLQVFFLKLGLDATLVALVFVHLIFVLPYVFLSLSDPWRAWDKRYASIAHGLGAGQNRTFWRIRLPMLARASLIAAAVGFSVSISQYLPTVLIGAGRLPTITSEAVALASGGDRRIIGVYAFLQMILPFAGFLVAALVPALMFRNRRDLKVS